jgi:hypothetical protein
MTHLMFSMLVAVLLCGAMALMGNRSIRERVYVATYLLLCCAVTTLVGGWVMYLIHG